MSAQRFRPSQVRPEEAAAEVIQRGHAGHVHFPVRVFALWSHREPLVPRDVLIGFRLFNRRLEKKKRTSFSEKGLRTKTEK